jgi:putative (di)nucleoside polyphosphate hydrolase
VDKEALPYRPCVGIMLLNRQGRAFVGRRSEGANAPEGEGKWWQMPQGGMDEGEEPEAAARRELFEETGVRSISIIARTGDWLLYDLPEELIGVAWEGRFRGQKQIWFAARFEGEESEIDLMPREGHEPEFDAWQWVRIEDLPSLIVPFKRAIYEAVVEELSPHVQAG